MASRTFEFCTLQFFNQWLEKEAGYFEGLASFEIDKQRQALLGAGGHFRVARNLPTKYEESRKLERYEPVLDILNKLGPVTHKNVTSIVSDTQQRISSEYGNRNVLSLTTKFMWLKFRSPVRIYDRQARIALGTKPGDFAAFNEAFSSCYARFQEQIEQACGNLSKVIPYSVEPTMKEYELRSLVSTKWFQERILDIYLWNQGSK
ncbi:hypothetical protein GPM19_10190 [Halomonas sp. ZH2S]|uniref:Uncharacterized protein n=1 Tax=Vreelandella zhuhanensis TaxID=2684210 RepID=A0A7X3H320_9GAMM|nr:hypothetical protein [Halomonas zhuhanensis]MWJ28570.1 hypothetical protein [Halomonas zhuhanensis]